MKANLYTNSMDVLVCLNAIQRILIGSLHAEVWWDKNIKSPCSVIKSLCFYKSRKHGTFSKNTAKKRSIIAFDCVESDRGGDAWGDGGSVLSGLCVQNQVRWEVTCATQGNAARITQARSVCVAHWETSAVRFFVNSHLKTRLRRVALVVSRGHRTLGISPEVAQLGPSSCPPSASWSVTWAVCGPFTMKSPGTCLPHHDGLYSVNREPNHSSLKLLPVRNMVTVMRTVASAGKKLSWDSSKVCRWESRGLPHHLPGLNQVSSHSVHWTVIWRGGQNGKPGREASHGDTVSLWKCQQLRSHTRYLPLFCLNIKIAQ